MKLTKTTIHHFKSFEDLKINFHDLNLLIGKNNSGKSNLIQALDLFFNYRKKFKNKNLDFCLFKNKGESSSKLIFTIECFFKLNNRETAIITKRLNRFYDHRLKSGKKAKERAISQYKEMRIKFIYKKSNELFRNNCHYEIYNYKTKKFKKIGIFQVENYIFNRISFTYIPAIRNLNNTEILNDIYFNLYNNISTIKKNKLISSANKIEKNIKDFIINDFEKEFNNKIKNKIFNILQVKFDFKSKDDKFIIETMNNLLPIAHDGTETNIEEKGAGLQSFIIIWLYNYLSTSARKNIIIALEEPEAHLHPSAQKNLLKSITEISKAKNNQIIITSHSPFLINNSALLEIVSMNRNKKNKGFVSTATQIKESELRLYDMDHFNRNMKIEKKDIFFSDAIILVEGISDKLVIEHFFKLYNINLDLKNISIIEYEGTPKIKHLLKLIIDFKIPYYLLFDNDFVYFKDINGNEHKGLFNLWRYTKVKVSSSDKNDILNNFNKITKLNKILKKYNCSSFRIDLERDMMTDKTLFYFQNYLNDKNLALQQVKKDSYSKRTKKIIQNIANEINNKSDIPRNFQTIINKIIKKFNL